MSEVLQVIIKLFAIVAKKVRVTSDEWDQIIKFLNEHLNEKVVDRHIHYMDHVTHFDIPIKTVDELSNIHR